MKKIKIIGIVLSTVFIMLAFAACGTPDVTITFDYNYDGSPAAYTQVIKSGNIATPPADPAREDYKFKGWYKTKTGSAAFDPESGHTKDTTYYAQWDLSAVTVTFDWNYNGATGSTSQKINIGGSAAQPTANPIRTGYLFIGWYSDINCTSEYDFATKISQATTIYAGWEEESGDTCAVVFSYNYAGGGNYYSTTINNGRRVSRPANPVRNGYAFIDWYSDAACTYLFNFNTFVTSNTTLYALWFDIYTFEAEYTYLDEISGAGYSVDVTGKEVIVKDSGSIADASNGFYISSLYKYGIEIVFNLTAEEAVENAQLVLRLSAEVMDMTIKSNKWLVQVNGENLEYPDMSFMNLPEPTSNEVRPFDNWTITKSLGLNKGDNTIKLIVDNNDALFGTMYATSPMIDCMYIYSPVEVDWKISYPDNIIGL